MVKEKGLKKKRMKLIRRYKQMKTILFRMPYHTTKLPRRYITPKKSNDVKYSTCTN